MERQILLWRENLHAPVESVDHDDVMAGRVDCNTLWDIELPIAGATDPPDPAEELACRTEYLHAIVVSIYHDDVVARGIDRYSERTLELSVAKTGSTELAKIVAVGIEYLYAVGDLDNNDVSSGWIDRNTAGGIELPGARAGELPQVDTGGTEYLDAIVARVDNHDVARERVDRNPSRVIELPVAVAEPAELTLICTRGGEYLHAIVASVADVKHSVISQLYAV